MDVLFSPLFKEICDVAVDTKKILPQECEILVVGRVEVADHEYALGFAMRLLISEITSVLFSLNFSKKLSNEERTKLCVIHVVFD